MLLHYLQERIRAGEAVPRIPERFALGQNGFCGFSVSEAGNMQVLPMHCHEYFELFLVLSDNLIHVVDGEETLLPKNTLVFIRPDDRHTQRIFSEASERMLVNITFSGAVAENLFTFLGHAGLDREEFLSAKKPPSRFLSDMQRHEFMTEFERRLQFCESGTDAFRRNVYGFLSYVFINLFASPDKPHESRSFPPQWLEVTCEKMKRLENFEEGLPRMVALSGKSQAYLSRSMKKYYGMTASAYINDLRLKYAISRLSDTENEDTMLGIILDSGFQSVGHFYKMFVKKYGTTPGHYKKEQRMALQTDDME